MIFNHIFIDQKLQKMSFREHSHSRSVKKNIRRQLPRRVQALAKNVAKNSKSTSEAKDFKLFQSGKLLELKSNKQIDSSQQQRTKISKKIFTTDQSNNQQDSNINQSIQVSVKTPNHQYFQQPLTFRPKKLKPAGSKRQLKNIKMSQLNLKLMQMKELVKSQDKQLKQMRNSMSQREMHRLVKIHSTQKLKLLETINNFNNNSSKIVKKG